MQTETIETEQTRAERPERPGSTRTCVGCGKRDDAADLVRVVLGPRVGQEPAMIAVDMGDGSFGRGAHLHATKACILQATKGGFARAFKCRVDAKPDDVAAQIVGGCDRRIAGLLMGARRAGHVAIGADAAAAALAKGEARLVVACDAGSVVERGIIAEAIAEGRAIAWKTKVDLGALLGRDEVAVCAVSHEAVAEQMMRARRVADAVTGVTTATISRSGDACMSREVR